MAQVIPCPGSAGVGQPDAVKTIAIEDQRQGTHFSGSTKELTIVGETRAQEWLKVIWAIHQLIQGCQRTGGGQHSGLWRIEDKEIGRKLFSEGGGQSGIIL